MLRVRVRKAIWLLFFSCSSVSSQPYMDGVVDHLTHNILVDENYAGNGLWILDIDRVGSEFMKFKFSSPSAHQTVFTVTLLSSADGSIIQSFDTEKQVDAWSSTIFTDKVRIEIRTEYTESQELYLSVAYTNAEKKNPLSIIEPDERELYSAYDDVSEVKNISMSVVLISLIKNNKPARCSGVYIGEGAVVSNYHCLSTQDECLSADIIFDYKSRVDGSLYPYRSFNCISVLDQDPIRDYVVLNIGKNDVLLTRTLEISDQTPKVGDPLIMLHHAGGEIMQVSKIDCWLASYSDHLFGHTCDSLEGSSGAPIFNSNFELVGIHSLMVDSESRQWSTQNRALTYINGLEYVYKE